MADNRAEFEDHLEKELNSYAKKILKSEMGRNLIKIPDLAKKLGASHTSLSTKISRGTFSTGFFFRVLQELGTKEVPVPPKEINKE